MDRRSWLWRRKSSETEKSPESSGSMSSQFDRFFDDQAYSNHRSQSPEVSSKAVFSDEDLNDNTKSLAEQLSAALLDIKAKEDLVKQHAKVAEEAVAGWEKAESEVLHLKQQLEAANQKNSTLEDRIGHLDGALKECVRQLRQSREEQEQKIQEAVAQKTSELDNHLIELRSQLQEAKSKTSASTDPNLELLEELELRTIERDLSTKAAEAASKQLLESTKRLAKLEAECRKLKAMSRKASLPNDHKSITASSVYAESFTDSLSDFGDRLLVIENNSNKMGTLELNDHDQFKKALARNHIVPLAEIDNLMGDFLEMEKLAASADTGSGSGCPESGASSSDQHDGESPLKGELEAMANRTATLEGDLEKMEKERVQLEKALSECQDQLMASKVQNMQSELKLRELQTQLLAANEAKNAEMQEKLEKMETEKAKVEMALRECQDKLKSSEDRYLETDVKLMELHRRLSEADEARRSCEAELEATNAKKKAAESKLVVLESDIESMTSRVGVLEEELVKEREMSRETEAKCRKMEDEVLELKKLEMQKAASVNKCLQIEQEEELAVAASKFAECQKTIASLGRQLKSLATMEDFLNDSDRSSSEVVPKEEESQDQENGCPKDSKKLHSADIHLPKKESDASKRSTVNAGGSSDNRQVKAVQGIAADRSRNAIAKSSTRSKSRRQP